MPQATANITGIGGFFFVARDPAALAAWYERHFGVLPVPGNYETPSWRQEAGETVFAPFSRVDDPVSGASRPFMLNFRVADLDAAVAALTSEGIDVIPDPDSPYPNGKFAWLSDPEGNPIELWEPAA